MALAKAFVKALAKDLARALAKDLARAIAKAHFEKIDPALGEIFWGVDISKTDPQNI